MSVGTSGGASERTEPEAEAGTTIEVCFVPVVFFLWDALRDLDDPPDRVRPWELEDLDETRAALIGVAPRPFSIIGDARDSPVGLGSLPLRWLQACDAAECVDCGVDFGLHGME